MVRIKLYWIREDGQGDQSMGEYASQAEARAAIPAMRKELLDQSGTEQHLRAGIDAGSWEIQEEDFDQDDLPTSKCLERISGTDAARGYTQADLDEVESPELTAEQLAQAKPFDEVFPELAEKMRRAQSATR